MRNSRPLLAWLVVLVIASTASLRAHATSILYLRAVSVDLTSAHPVMLVHERESGVSGAPCSSRAVGALSDLHTVGLGDTISLGGKSFRVGVISLRYSGMTYDLQDTVERHHIVCLIAASPKKLPIWEKDFLMRDKSPVPDEKCEALWVRAVDCDVLYYPSDNGPHSP